MAPHFVQSDCFGETSEGFGRGINLVLAEGGPWFTADFGARMLDDWFDERFAAAGARSFHFSIVRLLMAGVIWAVMGLGAGWRVAGVWVVAVLLLEWPLREITRPMARG